MRNHYENLKIPRDATQSEIKAAYRRLRSEHHPDRNPDPRSTLRMQIINEAWDVLSSPEKRANHDAEIARSDAFEEFFREMEEKANAETEEFVSTEGWKESEYEEKAEDEEKLAERQRYFDILGASWVRESRNATTYSKVEPTYRVFRTDFTVGSKMYYFYACYKSELVQKWDRVKKDLGVEANQYSSDTLSPRLANQALMDEMMENKGVLWSEGEPAGDVTSAFFRKG